MSIMGAVPTTGVNRFSRPTFTQASHSAVKLVKEIGACGCGRGRTEGDSRCSRTLIPEHRVAREGSRTNGWRRGARAEARGSEGWVSIDR